MPRLFLWMALLIGAAAPFTAQGVEISPSSANFGDIDVGGATLRDFEILQPGSSGVSIRGITVEGSGAKAFRLLPHDCGSRLNGGERCEVTVSFEPPSEGRWSAELVVSGRQSRDAVSLSGTASQGARLLPNPGEIDFGSLAPGIPRTLALTLSPVGEGSLRISRVHSPPAPFSIVSDDCSGLSLGAGQACRVEVLFTPTRSGTFSGNLTVDYLNPGERSASIPVKGVQVQGAIPSPSQPQTPSSPDHELSTHSLDFGPVALGFSQERQVMVRNTGTTPFNVGEVGGGNPLGEPFAFTGDECSKRPLGAGGSCRVTVRFAPLLNGAPSDAFDIPTDSPTLGTVQVAVRGEGVSAPLPAIVIRDRVDWEDDQDLPFGDLLLGRTAVTTVTVANLGSAPLTIASVALDDPLAPPFFIRSDGCTEQILSPGGECAIRIRFTPRTVGTYSDVFTIRSDDPRRPNLAMTLSGAGFVVDGNVPPEGPNLIHPDDGQTSLRDTVNFRWSRCEDPDGDPVFYHLFLSKTPDFTFVEARMAEVPDSLRLAGIGAAALALAGASLLRSRRKRILLLLLVLVLAAACSEEVEDNAVLEIGNLEDKTTYYWKVMSDDGRGGLTESEVRSFTTR